MKKQKFYQMFAVILILGPVHRCLRDCPGIWSLLPFRSSILSL